MSQRERGFIYVNLSKQTSVHTHVPAQIYALITTMRNDMRSQSDPEEVGALRGAEAWVNGTKSVGSLLLRQVALRHFIHLHNHKTLASSPPLGMLVLMKGSVHTAAMLTPTWVQRSRGQTAGQLMISQNDVSQVSTGKWSEPQRRAIYIITRRSFLLTLSNV